MRRMDRAVTNASEIAEIMSRCEVVRLALNHDPVPYILPVNFGMEPDGMTLYIRGAREGTKYDLIARDNRASFEMECSHALAIERESGDCTMYYESVIGWGYIDELTEEDDKRHGIETILRHYRDGVFPYSTELLSRTRILRLKVENRTAKRNPKRV